MKTNPAQAGFVVFKAQLFLRHSFLSCTSVKKLCGSKTDKVVFLACVASVYLDV